MGPVVGGRGDAGAVEVDPQGALRRLGVVALGDGLDEVTGELVDMPHCLLKKKDGWCNIITPNQNEGWMICNALEL